MKIETRIQLSDESKAKMISEGFELPPADIIFEMSPLYAAIFAAEGIKYENLIVHTSDYIYVRSVNTKKITPIEEVLYGIDSKGGIINTRYVSSVGEEKTLESILVPDIQSGKLKPGMNIDQYIQQLEVIRINNIAALQKVNEEVAEFPNHAPQREAARRAYEAEQNKIQKEKDDVAKAERLKTDAEALRQSAEKETRRLARLAWAQEHGSARLRKGLEQGYSCIKQYEEEFSRFVLGEDYVWDRDNVVEEKTRSCPSLKALEIVEILIKDKRIGQGNADVQWLPDGLSALVKDEDWDEDTKQGCEAISVNIKGITGLWYKVMA
jgi:hypothetical protein